MSLSPYALILKIRHFLYDKGIIKTRTAETFTISVGNITVGGTGKTPHTEMLLRMLAVQAGKTGSVEEGIEQLYAFLNKNGIDTANTLIYDGSGLSRDNQITAGTLLDVLSLMSTSPYFSYYYDSLATPDDRGDLILLRRFLRPFKRTRDVHVKGGTIDGVKAQAGYVKDKNGRLIAFAFIANNLPDKSEDINRFYEELIKKLLSLPD